MLSFRRLGACLFVARAHALVQSNSLPAVAHAVFSKHHCREIADRWRPAPLVLDECVMLRSPSNVQRYCRAIIECSQEHPGFGVMQSSSEGLCLFLMERRAAPTGQALDLIRASLSEDDIELLVALEHLRRWHRGLFPKVLLSVTDPHLDDLLRNEAAE